MSVGKVVQKKIFCKNIFLEPSSCPGLRNGLVRAGISILSILTTTSFVLVYLPPPVSDIFTGLTSAVLKYLNCNVFYRYKLNFDKSLQLNPEISPNFKNL